MLRAGSAHAWFELIHPFEVGHVGPDAHCSTALSGIAAARATVQLVSAHHAVRDAYYQALAEIPQRP